jgi:hypothetical protein
MRLAASRSHLLVRRMSPKQAAEEARSRFLERSESLNK